MAAPYSASNLLKNGRESKVIAERNKMPNEFKHLYQSSTTQPFKEFEEALHWFNIGVDQSIEDRDQMIFRIERALAANSLATMEEYEEDKSHAEVCALHEGAIEDMATARRIFLLSFGDDIITSHELDGENYDLSFMNAKLAEFADDAAGDHFIISICTF
jgi:hypothetical protein